MKPSSIQKLDPNFRTTDSQTGLDWYDAQILGVRGQGWSETQRSYARLPAKAESLVREPVWQLAQHSAGLYVGFITSSKTVDVRWQLWSEDLSMPHMPATGVSGLDLYIKDPNRPGGSCYHWLGSCHPQSFPHNQIQLVSQLNDQANEFRIYLPLYNGIEKIEIGVETDTIVETPPIDVNPPIVIYGTSIVQGGCASRPGMSYPAIIGRFLDRTIINLGFSGNGQAEEEMADLLAELNPSVYVLDYCPNLDKERICHRTEPFVNILRNVHPDIPIVLVENITYQNQPYVSSISQTNIEKNLELRAAYNRMRADGIKHLLYIRGDQLLGSDGEATVDGIHPTDLGFIRIAESITPILSSLL